MKVIFFEPAKRMRKAINSALIPLKVNEAIAIVSNELETIEKLRPGYTDTICLAFNALKHPHRKIAQLAPTLKNTFFFVYMHGHQKIPATAEKTLKKYFLKSNLRLVALDSLIEHLNERATLKQQVS